MKPINKIFNKFIKNCAKVILFLKKYIFLVFKTGKRVAGYCISPANEYSSVRYGIAKQKLVNFHPSIGKKIRKLFKTNNFHKTSKDNHKKYYKLGLKHRNQKIFLEIFHYFHVRLCKGHTRRSCLEAFTNQKHKIIKLKCKIT